MKSNQIFLVLLLGLIMTISACNSDDNSPLPPAGTVLQGTFVDFPISGLSYSAGSQSGITDAAGTFNYEVGDDITFTLGGLQLGTTAASPTLTPLDFVNNATVSNQVMRNITAMLFSLDQDQDPSNGAQLSAAVQSGLVSENFAMDIDHFYIELKRIVSDLNTANGTTLAVVGANDATEQLTGYLGISSEFEVLPRSIVGTQWVQGDYFAYNTVPSAEYVIKIGSDLTDVRYHFGGGNGFLMDVSYNNEVMTGLGNIYTDLNDPNPTMSNPAYDYRNRISSPGYVFDYGPQTFISYACFYRQTGDSGELAGKWHSFLEYDQKRVGQAPEVLSLGNTELIISDVNAAGEFQTNEKRYDQNNGVIFDTTFVFPQQELDTENIMIIDMGGIECLFADTTATLYAGQLSIKN